MPAIVGVILVAALTTAEPDETPSDPAGFEILDRLVALLRPDDGAGGGLCYTRPDIVPLTVLDFFLS